MSNVSSYIPKMKEKIDYYDKNNIKCLYLFEEDFTQNKQDVNLFKDKTDIFLKEINNNIYNKHLHKIYITNEKI
jgi:hypothetical protein